MKGRGWKIAAGVIVVLVTPFALTALAAYLVATRWSEWRRHARLKRAMRDYCAKRIDLVALVEAVKAHDNASPDAKDHWPEFGPVNEPLTVRVTNSPRTMAGGGPWMQ